MSEQQPIQDLNQIPPVEDEKEVNKRRWILWGAAALIIIVVLCCGGGIWLFAKGMSSVINETPAVQDSLDQFMRTMESKDVDRAYAMFSTRAKRNIDKSQLEDMVDGLSFSIFQGYQEIQITNFYLNSVMNSNPDQAQGQVAEIEAIVIYANGFEGNLTATLEKEDGVWRMFDFNLVVPPEKYEHDYQGLDG